MFEKIKVGGFLSKYPKAEGPERKGLIEKLDALWEFAIPMAADELRYNRMLYMDAAEIFEKLYKKERLPVYIKGLGDSKDNVRALYKETLKKQGKASILPNLADSLASDDNVLRRTAGEMIVEIGDASVTYKIIPLLKSENRDVKKTAMDTLASLKSEKASEAILPLMDDPDSWVRRKAVEAVCRLKDKATLAKLRHVALNEKDAAILKMVIETVGEIGGKEDAVAILGLIRNPDMMIRQMAAGAVIAIADSEIVPKVVELLMDEDVNTRRTAVDVLNGLKDPKTAGALVRAIKDGDWWVREIATDALSALGGEKISQMIMGLLTDQDEYARRSAVEFYCRVKDPAAFQILLNLLADKDWWVREKAITALGLIGDPAAIPHIEKLVGDKEVKWAIPSALAAIGGAAALKPLGLMLKDSQRAIRLEALRAVTLIDSDETVGLLKRAALDQDVEVMASALKLLREKTGQVWLKEDVEAELGKEEKAPVTKAAPQTVTPIINRVDVKPGEIFTEAILVADLCNSTDMANTYGDNFVFQLASEFCNIILAAAEDEKVSFSKSTGDGYLMTFPSVENALGTAKRTLDELAARNAAVEPKRRIASRFAVNIGECRVDMNGDRQGVAVNMTFRVDGVKRDTMIPAPGGVGADEMPMENRILLTEPASLDIKGNARFPTRLLGFFELKGITGLHRIYQLMEGG
ncbi:MAG: HEAT repeat domain-containing protein [Nitrospinae bacterium]|nr:HEAT repeat domain-containing protein [Nitrospinota bacterium]